MSLKILRPVFSENQILAAADVNGIVNHARAARARHNQYLHHWGIAQGLALTAEDRTDTSGAYKEVSLTPGVAIDGHGREIVVTETHRLSEDLFDQLNVAESVTDPANPPQYPVFLLFRDQIQQGSAMAPSVCLGSEATRTVEGFEITFGRAGEAAKLEEQLPIALGAALDASGVTWKILLGFVQWDGARFSGVADEADGIGRRYAGVRAADVSAPNDSLTLRSAQPTVGDKAAVVIDNRNGGELRFGLQDSSGQVVPVFTVNAKGDVTTEGKILGAIAGGVQLESGVITDGALVPLPAGITQEQIDEGKATIQVHLAPRFQQPGSLPDPGLNQAWLMQPLECYAQERRVVCRVRWQSTGAGPGPFILPGVCDYQVFGFVKA